MKNENKTKGQTVKVNNQVEVEIVRLLTQAEKIQCGGVYDCVIDVEVRSHTCDLFFAAISQKEVA